MRLSRIRRKGAGTMQYVGTRWRHVGAAVLLLALAAACGGTSEPTASNGPSATPAGTPATEAAANGVSKLLVFVVENHSFEQMRTQMPYAYSLAKRFGYATDFSAITHPSLPNYIAMVTGSTQGIIDDAEPASHRLLTPSVFQRAMAAGKTVGTYAEGMPSNCATTHGGNRYVPRHNPWTYFPAERDACGAWDVPFSQFAPAVSAGQLPNIAFAIPNDCHNAHDRDCSLADADAWFKSHMTEVFDGPDWRSGQLAIVLTADEDDRHSGNRILTVVIHPSQHANIVSRPLTLYSLSRLFSEVTGTQPLGNAASAPSMFEAFGLQ